MNLADRPRRPYHSRLIGHEFPATAGEHSVYRAVFIATKPRTASSFEMQELLQPAREETGTGSQAGW